MRFNRTVILLALFCLLPGAVSAAEFHQVRFSLPGTSPCRVSLRLQRAVVVAQHAKTAGGDSIRVRVNENDPDWDDANSLPVEVRDRKGRILWSHDFGLNLSSPEGNTVAVSYQPRTHLLLVGYSGYKSDNDHRLLRVAASQQLASLREYDSAQADILPFLKRQPGFPDDYRYLIEPVELTKEGVKFECLPLQKPEVQSVHPFSSEEPAYEVTASVDAKGKLNPTAVRSLY